MVNTNIVFLSHCYLFSYLRPNLIWPNLNFRVWSNGLYLQVKGQELYLIIRTTASVLTMKFILSFTYHDWTSLSVKNIGNLKSVIKENNEAWPTHKPFLQSDPISWKDLHKIEITQFSVLQNYLLRIKQTTSLQQHVIMNNWVWTFFKFLWVIFVIEDHFTTNLLEPSAPSASSLTRGHWNSINWRTTQPSINMCVTVKH